MTVLCWHQHNPTSTSWLVRTERPYNIRLDKDAREKRPRTCQPARYASL